jgi:hypothetical protein
VSGRPCYLTFSLLVAAFLREKEKDSNSIRTFVIGGKHVKGILTPSLPMTGLDDAREQVIAGMLTFLAISCPKSFVRSNYNFGGQCMYA